MRVGCFLFLALVCSQADAWAISHNRINDVRLREHSGAVVVEITGEEAPNFTTFKQDKPRRIIVDVAECAFNGVPARIQGGGQLVDTVATRQYGHAPHGIARVIITLHREAEYKVTIRGGSLFVHLTPGAGGLLVSAGVPVGPARALRPVASAARHDRALADELVATGPAVVADPLPPPAATRLPEPTDEVAGEPAPLPPPAVSSGPAPRPAAVEAPAPPEPPAPTEPVRVAMATPAPVEEPAPELVIPQPEPPPPPVEVAQEDDEEVEEVEEVPVEVVEEVEEIPEAPLAAPEDVIPPPPPGADAAGQAAEDAIESETSDDAVPVPPGSDYGEEVPVPPPPPEEEYVPPQPPETSYSEVEERVEISGAVKQMTWVGFQQTKQTSRVFVKTNEPVEYRVTEEGNNLVVMELENTTIPTRNNKRFLDTHFFDSAVSMIVPREVGGIGRSVRIEIQLKNRVPYRMGREENMVYVSFERPQ